MKCENCGFENNGKAKFCTRCGASLAQKNEVQTQQKMEIIQNILLLV